MSTDDASTNTSDIWSNEAIAALFAAVAASGKQEDLGFRLPPSLVHPGEHGDHDAWTAWRQSSSDLADRISWAFTERDLLLPLTCDSRAKGRADRLAQIFAQADLLYRSLQASPELASAIDNEMPLDFSAPAPEEFLGQFVEAARRLRARTRDKALLPKEGMSDKRMSKQGVLLARLAQVYRDTFGMSPAEGTIKARNAYRGPFPTFVLEVMKRAGATMTPGALTKAMQEHLKI